MNTTRLMTVLALTGLLFGAPVAEASPTTQPGPHAGHVNGRHAPAAQDLYDVEFIAIDGQNMPPRNEMWLVPGRYVLTVRILADQTRQTLMRRTLDEPGYNQIEVVVEAGKTYEIRAKFDRQNRRSPYSTILYRVIE